MAALLLLGALAQVSAVVPGEAGGADPDASLVEAGSHGGGTGPGGRLSARQKSLDHFRKLQREIRSYKKQQRFIRKQEAMARVEAETTRSAHDRPSQVRGPSIKPDFGTLFCLSILGLAALSDPSVLGLASQGALIQQGQSINATAMIDRYMSEATAKWDALGPACLAAAVAGPPIPPCTVDYRTGVRAQVQNLRAGMVALFVAPASLGAGECLQGESPQDAKARIRLTQADVLADYDGLTADAATLQYQVERDGYAIQSLANGIFVLQDAAKVASGGSTGLAADAAFTLGQVGTSVYGAGFGIEAIGDIFATISNTAISYKARYLKWANSQVPALLRNCTGTALIPASASASFPDAPPSPVAALEDALLKLTAGCLLAEQQHLDLAACGADSLIDLHWRNGTVGDLYQDLRCLSSDVTAGSHMACPSAPSADDLLQSTINAQFGEFQAEITAVGYLAQGLGNALFAASQGFQVAGNAASEAGNRQEGAALSGVEAALMVFGRAIYSDGYELLRISAVSRRWLADFTKAFTAQARAELNERESTTSSAGRLTGPASSSTGFLQETASASSSTAAPGPDAQADPFVASSSTGEGTGLGPWPASCSGPAVPDEGESAWTGGSSPLSSSAHAEPSSNGAGRGRPLLIGGVLLLFSLRSSLGST